jgi:hypothetical protein
VVVVEEKEEEKTKSELVLVEISTCYSNDFFAVGIVCTNYVEKNAIICNRNVNVCPRLFG